MNEAEPPPYFETVRRETSARWDQLEADPESAGVWHQLFRQVQSPRHVVSELLQNADDAGATEAWIRIDSSGTFILEHNGADFTEDHFRSLCRFGYSNKRSLFTIGFRGIGFKSTFSLGSPVTVHTPSLAVAFHDRRFTEPTWVGRGYSPSERTRISVLIADPHRQQEIEKNLDDWIHSPLSLLFFRNIRCIHIAGTALRWISQGTGPVENSEWVTLEGGDSARYLIVRSAPEPFPTEALEEIQKERMATGQDISFPPCSVDLVLGHAGRLFAVLPSGGDNGLPFSANAPFMLTPDREHIKPPAISPVNRWLLERMGRIAASVMLDWIGNASLPPKQRAEAYDWLPEVKVAGSGPDFEIGAWVRKAFDATLKDRAVLLTDAGDAVVVGQAVKLPSVALEVWGSDQASAMFDKLQRQPLCRYISKANLQKLYSRLLVDRLNENAFLTCLGEVQVTKPDIWDKLLTLWDFVRGVYASPLTQTRLPQLDSLRLVPVAGSQTLHAARGTIRLGNRVAQIQADEDWQFLVSRVSVVDPNWLEFLTDKGRRESEAPDKMSDLLKDLSLGGPASKDRLVGAVAFTLTEGASSDIQDWVRLAHIAASLDAKVGESFRFVTRDGEVRSLTHAVLHDVDGDLETILPPSYANAHLLHPAYEEIGTRCRRDEWIRWMQQPGSGLLGLPPITAKREEFCSNKTLEKRLAQIQSIEGVDYPWTVNNSTYQRYYFTDADFPEAVINHWAAHSTPSEVATIVTRKLLEGTRAHWASFLKAVAQQTTTGGKTPSKVKGFDCAAAWLRRLWETPCLPDKFGALRLPSDLMRRTPETEPFLDVESFVDARLDNEHTRNLLDALGVASKPVNADRLLSCLGALRLAPDPPRAEVEKWYRRLDLFTANCAPADLQVVASTFAQKELVLSGEGDWLPPNRVFLEADESDAPGVPVVMESVRELRLWERLRVVRRPTVETVIDWLRTLPGGRISDKSIGDRVEAMLKRHPVRIWTEVGHWLDLSGRWVPVGNLDLAVDEHQRVAYSHLHEWVKQRVADLRSLPHEVVVGLPFSALKPLGGAIEDRIEMDGDPASVGESPPWLKTFGETLCRVRLEDDDKTSEAREVGHRLMSTRIQVKSSIQVIPFFEGKPAGTSRQQELAWVGQTIFILRIPQAKLAKLLPDHAGKALPDPNLRQAIAYCFERSDVAIWDYMRENFDLDEAMPLPSPTPGQPDPIPEPRPDGQPIPKPAPTETDGAFSGEGGPSTGDGTPPAPQGPQDPAPYKPRQPRGPGLIELFAHSKGFVSEGDTFTRPDGSRIQKHAESGFGWLYHDTQSGQERRLRAIDACLERGAVEVPHEAWAAIENQPDCHSIVLKDGEGNPVEIGGSDLCSMRDQGQLKIYPASYRLRLE